MFKLFINPEDGNCQVNFEHGKMDFILMNQIITIGTFFDPDSLLYLSPKLVALDLDLPQNIQNLPITQYMSANPNYFVNSLAKSASFLQSWALWYKENNPGKYCPQIVFPMIKALRLFNDWKKEEIKEEKALMGDIWGDASGWNKWDLTPTINFLQSLIDKELARAEKILKNK